MQHMTRTTGNLSELAPSFEKQRGDARAGQHDKASEAERAAAKNAFGSLVKKSDDAGTWYAGEEAAGGASSGLIPSRCKLENDDDESDLGLRSIKFMKSPWSATI